VIRRERPVAVGILAASLAFRLFALIIPLTYLLVAGLGFAGETAAGTPRPGVGDHLGELVISSVAAAARSSNRARWLALIFGGAATLLAAAAVLEVLRWVHLLAWRMAPARSRTNPWLVLGLIAGLAVMAAASAGAEQARADAQGLADELTVVLVTAGVQVVVTAVLWLGLSLALPRPAAVPWTALVPGACLFAAGFQGFSLAVSLYFAPRAARASTVYGSLGVALVLLVSRSCSPAWPWPPPSSTPPCGSAGTRPGVPSRPAAGPGRRAARPRSSTGGTAGCGRPRTRR
jgi:uncharacterized BrkB/YihY/UPF0761 family membrane protein